MTINPLDGRIAVREDGLYVSALLKKKTIRVIIREDVVSALVDEYTAVVTTRPATQDEVALALQYGEAALQLQQQYTPHAPSAYHRPLSLTYR